MDIPAGPEGQLDIWEKSAYNHNDFTAMTPQQYSEPSCPQRGARPLKGPRLTRRKDSGGAGAETPTAPSPYQEAKGGASLEFGWHHEAMSAIVPKTVLGGQRSF